MQTSTHCSYLGSLKVLLLCGLTYQDYSARAGLLRGKKLIQQTIRLLIPRPDTVSVRGEGPCASCYHKAHRHLVFVCFVEETLKKVWGTNPQLNG